MGLTVAVFLLAMQDPASQDRISRALEDARRELAAERDRMHREEEALEKELKEAQAKSGALSDELVDRTVSLGQKTKTVEQLRSERARLRQARLSSNETWSEVRTALSDAASKISDLLSTLPESETREAQKELVRRVKAEHNCAGSEPPDLSAALALFELVMTEIGTTAVYDATIRNARGVEETADLLRVGMILCAYRGKASAQVGLRMAAPGGEEGFRWSEDLPAWASEEVVKALDGMRSGAGVYLLPVDVAQEISVDRRYATRGAWDFLVAGGPVMVPIGAVAFLAVLLVAERLLILGRRGRASASVGEAVIEVVGTGDLVEAERLASQTSSPVGRVMGACIARREQGVRAMEDAAQEAILHELPSLERFLPAIAVLAGVAPLLGLLGTVTGMMTTFDMITAYGSGEAGMMAGGIYEALITTVAGLVIAIPLLLLHSFLSGRVDRVLADMERFSATLINRLARR